MAKRQPTAARQWAARIARWQRSGLTSKEFGQREGFRGDQLSWWKWHLARGANTETASRRRVGKKSKLAQTRPLEFVEVTVPKPVAVSPGVTVEIVLRNGRVARVPQGCDGAWLTQMLSAAERAD